MGRKLGQLREMDKKRTSASPYLKRLMNTGDQADEVEMCCGSRIIDNRINSSGYCGSFFLLKEAYLSVPKI